MNSDILICYSSHDEQDRVISFSDAFRSRINARVTRDEHTTKDPFSIDFSINIDARDPANISDAVDGARILIPLISPHFFSDENCLLISTLFLEKQKEKNKQLIFPIIIEECFDSNDELLVHILKELDGKECEIATRLAEMCKNVFFPWYQIRNDDVQIESKYNELVRKIAEIEVSTRTKRKSNWHIIDKNIDSKTSGAKEKREKFYDVKNRALSEPRAYSEKPVCVIYTGGTVGMVRKDKTNRNSELIIGDISEVISFVPKLKELEFDVDFYSYSKPLDSSNITSEDWVSLAEIIEELYELYQGFVILHGANTMAYSASALSFMFENLAKPIILTGAEIPLVELYSDAEQNIIRAIKTAKTSNNDGPSTLPEVCILYGNSLMRGNRATKKNSLSTTDGFFSPNYENLGAVQHEQMRLEYRSIRDTNNAGSEVLRVQKNITGTKIAIVDVYPDMDMGVFKSICSAPGLKGLIIRTYGTGNAPENPKDFLDELEKLIDKEVVVVNLTQCSIGRVELRLFETNARLFDIGVISGGDMTTEAAYCKLKYLFGIFSASRDWEELKRCIQIDQRGELTDSTYSIKYDCRSADVDTKVNEIYHGKSRNKPSFDKKSINNGVFRLQNIRIKNVKSESFDDNYITFELKVYVNANHIPNEQDFDKTNLIGTFVQKIDKTQSGYRNFSFNLDVTDKIRKILQTDTRQDIVLQLVSRGIEFEFDSMQLIICTRKI